MALRETWVDSAVCFKRSVTPARSGGPSRPSDEMQQLTRVLEHRQDGLEVGGGEDGTVHYLVIRHCAAKMVVLHQDIGDGSCEHRRAVHVNIHVHNIHRLIFHVSWIHFRQCVGPSSRLQC